MEARYLEDARRTTGTYPAGRPQWPISPRGLKCLIPPHGIEGKKTPRSHPRNRRTGSPFKARPGSRRRERGNAVAEVRITRDSRRQGPSSNRRCFGIHLEEANIRESTRESRDLQMQPATRRAPRRCAIRIQESIQEAPSSPLPPRSAERANGNTIPTTPRNGVHNESGRYLRESKTAPPPELSQRLCENDTPAALLAPAFLILWAPLPAAAPRPT